MSEAPALLVDGATALLPEGLLRGAALLAEDGRISAVGPRADVSAPSGVHRIDGEGLLLAPGLIELQLNGGFGRDFTSQPESVWEVGARLCGHGVTAFLPTIVSSPREVAARAQAVLAEGPPEGYRGALPLGLHLEGPFLNPAASGAHDPAWLRAPDPGDASAWTPAAGVRVVTLAPELPGALEVIAILAGNGVVVAAGHSAAGYDEGAAGIEAGIRYATHLFNAMPPLDRREPGLIAALLEDERVTVGLIPDGIHVHASLIRLVHALVGTDRFSAVTDATAALGMPDGDYRLGDHPVTLEEGAVRRPDGRLGGSALAADDAVRRLAKMTGVAPEDALAAMTSVPSTVLGMAGERGALRPGARADLILLTPELNPVATFVGAQTAFER
jgi:N-acetylglucosamine-6-phosphate deacetylase